MEQHERALVSRNIKLLTTVSACRHMVCTSPVSCLNMDTDRVQMTTNSLAYILVKMATNHMTRMNPDLDICHRLMTLMANFSLYPDTLSVICKVSPLLIIIPHQMLTWFALACS